MEAKAPEVAVEVGYHEAQFYAAYLNQNYPTGINPAHFVLATNGKQFAFGYWDSKPVLEESVSDLRPQSQLLDHLQKLCGRNILNNHALECLNVSAVKRSLLPYNLAGGPALLRATINPNHR